MAEDARQIEATAAIPAVEPDPAGIAVSDDPNVSLAERVTVLELRNQAMSRKLARLRATVKAMSPIRLREAEAEVELPSQAEAEELARAKGSPVLSKDGYVMPRA